MSGVYRALVSVVDKRVPTGLKPIWDHPAGPKTIFFWAPTFKWLLVIAGLADINRPVQNVSLYQSAALAATGLIWSRYSMVIIPKNYNLLSVNAFVALTGLYQLARIAKHEYAK
ncbi:putative mitochondrial pyruvate carrier 2 [Schistosoma japonicum]|uniref:Mitochondrial pyruvate carrier n=1 Tax=Schistosoma japonicum TaxID=6182 RepID=Q86ED4_SCHJA|nr:SJCHGC06193 protein [Schistosoma japonicum]TNN15021.1 putative mitochondrial pyruvate carrier 2 [Schistosoma japonicum]CAX70212.1 hypothetical protein [Schistosoma japonicum]CAX74708.1 hypothetical protein [Schistosoma japonicum]CAX74709.1 hypothetical protein [Schistosoma japonicum]